MFRRSARYSPRVSDLVFILAGVGVSAESGIPTFRGMGGLRRNYRTEVGSAIARPRYPLLVREFYSICRRPNRIPRNRRGDSRWW